MNRLIPGSERPTLKKSPGATLDYSWDWSDWLPDGDAVYSYEVTSQNVSVVSTNRVGDVVTAMVAGGVPGKDAWIRCRVTTEAEPRKTDFRTIYLIIAQR
jgi:hypothetical protein